MKPKPFPEPRELVRGRIAQILATSKRVLLTGHVGIDGDALGSAVALWHALRTLGADPVIALSERVPPLYRFFVPSDACRILGSELDARSLVAEMDAALVLDNNSWERLGYLRGPLEETTAPVLCMDHHLADEAFSAHHLLDTKASATGVMVKDLLDAMDVPLDESMATALFVALVNDTGWFRFGNTDARTLVVATDLVTAGARPGWINESLYEQESLAALKLRARFFDSVELHDGGRVAVGTLYREDLEITGATYDDTEVLVSLIRRLAGVVLAAFVREEPDGSVKLSFRSRDGWSARGVALQFGGGGHEVAAGASCAGPLAVTRTAVLAALSAEVVRGESARAP